MSLEAILADALRQELRGCGSRNALCVDDGNRAHIAGEVAVGVAARLRSYPRQGDTASGTSWDLETYRAKYEELIAAGERHMDRCERSRRELVVLREAAAAIVAFPVPFGAFLAWTENGDPEAASKLERFDKAMDALRAVVSGSPEPESEHE